MKVLLADLDGTLIETISGEKFPQHCMDMKFKDGIIDAIKGYSPSYIGIVTNQGGIEKGFVDEQAFKAKLNLVAYTIRTLVPGTLVKRTYCASNDPDDYDRKPNPGMLIGMLRLFESIAPEDINQVIMIGDRPEDEEASKAAAMVYNLPDTLFSYKHVDDFLKEYGKPF